MRRRYFVRVLNAFKHYRPGHEVCLEAEEFGEVRARGLVTVMYEERDGERVDVDTDEGADPRAQPAPPQAETVPLDTLTDEERELILARRAKTAEPKAKAKSEAKGEAKGEAKAKAEAPTVKE